MNPKIEESQELARLLAAGEVKHELLRSREDAFIARVRYHDGGKVIVKLWKRPGARGLLRRLTKTGNLDREWKVLNHLNHCDVPVPRALTKYRFGRAINGYTDAVVMEDLGPSETGMEYLSRLVAQETHDERLRFEEKLIELTAFVIRAGVLDSDHHLVNILLVPLRGIVRIDFEIAVIARFPRLHKRRLARMIAGLMASYAIAVHPHRKPLAEEFALRLAEELYLPTNLLKRSRIVVGKLLDIQQEKSGRDLRWTPPW